MSDKEMLTAVVKPEFFSSYGFKSDGSWYNPSEPLKVGDFKKGVEYTVEYFKSAKGNRYITKVNGATGTPTTQASTGNGASSSSEDKMTKADWERKDKRIAYESVLSSVLSSPAFAQALISKTPEEVTAVALNQVAKILEEMEQVIA